MSNTAETSASAPCREPGGILPKYTYQKSPLARESPTPTPTAAATT
eukprot:CAMPEP_0119353618 /NCGR_PEP_ID=MMETSP1334-20130426/2728_1 /TAXON_ID=127549 /ORGANISM="Calcidiscus leptoporus, Strain RCC1130" /LENGTH=45 /DNA_ID= /DNA_START= /DNA_END= /DNA_ORIENTATION=